MTTEHDIRRKYEALYPLMNERMRRCWAGVEADALGKGGIALVERATGMSRTTIRAGREELRTGVQNVAVVQVRRAGGGRPRLEERHPDLLKELEILVDPVTRGDSESPLRWTSRSMRKLAAELTERGKTISPQKVAQLLLLLGYRLDAVQKIVEGAARSNRNAQFEIVNERVEMYQARNAPVISIDIRQKEFVGGLVDANLGRESIDQLGSVCDSGCVKLVHAKAGVCDACNLEHDEGWNNIDVDDDTLEFAAESVSRWWSQIGCNLHVKATELLVIARADGSRFDSSRTFRTVLQRFADRTGLMLGVSRFPSGISKWSRIEHQTVYLIRESWREYSSIEREIVVQLIGTMRTTSGALVKTRSEPRPQTAAIQANVIASGSEKCGLVERDSYDEWNYKIVPR